MDATLAPVGNDLQLIAPAVFAFVAVIACVFAVLALLKAQSDRKIRNRLHDFVVDSNDEGIDTVIVRDMELSAIPVLNRALKGASWARRLDMLLLQADIKMRVGAFLVLIAVMAGVTFVLLEAVLGRPWAAAVVAVFVGSIPLLVAKHKKRQRTLRF